MEIPLHDGNERKTPAGRPSGAAGNSSLISATLQPINKRYTRLVWLARPGQREGIDALVQDPGVLGLCVVGRFSVARRKLAAS
jgi:hypothetical protein